MTKPKINVIYVSDGLSDEKYYSIFSQSLGYPKQQMQKYNKTMMQGFSKVEAINFSALSVLPVNSTNSTKMIILGGKDNQNNIQYKYLPSSRNKLLRLIMNMVGGFFNIVFRDKSNTYVVIDVLNIAVNIGVISACKLKRIPIIGIVTDLPCFLNVSNNIKNMMNNNIAACNKYVFLSEEMNKKINVNGKPYVVIEGQIDDSVLCDEKPLHKEDSINCIYAGSVAKTNGIDRLVDGFVSANIEGASLSIYGQGDYADELKRIQEKHSNVKYYGAIPNYELIPILQNATLLINPRPSQQEFTKYSFPSKNMEYMASGTPLLTTHLASLPDEYIPYVYLIEDESVEGIAETIKTVLLLDRRELDEKGRKAQQFVFTKKTGKMQANRIVNSLILG